MGRLRFADGIGMETSTDDNLFDSPIKNTPAKVAVSMRHDILSMIVLL